MCEKHFLPAEQAKRQRAEISGVKEAGVILMGPDISSIPDPDAKVKKYCHKEIKLYLIFRGWCIKTHWDGL